MRVAYICADPGVPVFGVKGSSVHVQSVIRALRRQGAEVCLFAARFDGEPPPDLADLPRRALPRPPNGSTASRETALLAANEVLGRMLTADGHFDLIYERYSLWSYAAMEHAAARGSAGLLEVNAPLIAEQIRHRELIDRAGAERVAWRVFSAATALLAVSDGVADYLRSVAASHGRVHIVPNGVDPERFLPSARTPARDTFTVGFVGTLKPWHGLDVLLTAFARLHARAPAARLLLVGDGPERTTVEHQIAELDLASVVELTGAVSPAEVPALLGRMDVATAPYPSADNCYFSPLKLFEYMAAGLPVVASHVGQVASVIHHGRNGLLCAPGNAAALAGNLEQIYQFPALRRQLGAAAREAVLAHHTWDAVARRILDLAGITTASLEQIRHA